MANTQQIKLFNQLDLTLTQVENTDTYQLVDINKGVNILSVWESITDTFNIPDAYKGAIPNNTNLSTLSCKIEGNQIKSVDIRLKTTGLNLSVYYVLDLKELQLTMETNTDIHNDIIKIF